MLYIKSNQDTRPLTLAAAHWSSIIVQLVSSLIAQWKLKLCYCYRLSMAYDSNLK